MKLTQEQRRAGLRKLCLMKLTHELGGRGTAREVAQSIGKEMKHICPRFTELLAAKLIRDTGLRIHGKGRPEVIWAVAGVTHPANDAAAIHGDLPAAVTTGQMDDVPDWFRRFGN